MTLEETRKILHVLKINYPQSFRNYTASDSNEFLQLWAEAFKKVPVQIVMEAVKSIIYEDTRDYAPNIGQVNDKIRRMLTGNSEIEAVQAWDQVLTFCHKYGGELYDHYQELPDMIRQILPFHSLQNIANGNTQDNEKYKKPAFIKQYKELKESSDLLKLESGELLLSVKSTDMPKQIK